MGSSILDSSTFKDRLYTDSILSDLENSMDTMPGTPLSKCTEVDLEATQQREPQTTPSHPVSNRRESRIKSETMLSRVGSFVTLTDDVTLEDIFEYDWADSDSESPDGKLKESYMVQELLADYLKVKSFKRKYPELTRRTMDAYERSWLQQEGLVPVGRADLGLTALRTDEVMKLLQDDYPEVHAELSDLFQRRRFQQAAELQKRQYEAARIERGEARAEAARRRALDSASDFNHRLIGERLTTRRCYWDLQTMQIHFPQRTYKLIQSSEQKTNSNGGSYPVAVIPGQFAEYFVRYTPEQLMQLPLSRCVYPQPSRRHRAPPPLPTHLRFGSLAPRPVCTQSETMKPFGLDGGVPVMTSTADSRSLPHTPVKETKPDANDPERSMDRSLTSSPRPHSQPVLSPSAAGVSPAKVPNSSSLDRQNERTKCGQTTTDGTGETGTVSCSVCKQEASSPFVRCAECKATGHPRCFSLPDSMLPGVMGYAWSCMECKRCVECNDSGHEDQMMFCDRCDRGYHAFCVGLKKIPHGNWDCPLCVPQGNRNKRRRSSATVRRRSDESRAKRPRKARKRVLSTLSDSNDEETTQPRPPEATSEKQTETEEDENDNDDGVSVRDSQQEVKPKQRSKRKPRQRKLDESLLTTSSDEASLTQGSVDSTSQVVRRKRGRPSTAKHTRRGRPNKAELTESEDAEATENTPTVRRSKPRTSRRTKISPSVSPSRQTENSTDLTKQSAPISEDVVRSDSPVVTTEKQQSPSFSIGPEGDSNIVPTKQASPVTESAQVDVSSTLLENLVADS